MKANRSRVARASLTIPVSYYGSTSEEVTAAPSTTLGAQHSIIKPNGNQHAVTGLVCRTKRKGR